MAPSGTSSVVEDLVNISNQGVLPIAFIENRPTCPGLDLDLPSLIVACSQGGVWLHFESVLAVVVLFKRGSAVIVAKVR